MQLKKLNGFQSSNEGKAYVAGITAAHQARQAHAARYGMQAPRQENKGPSLKA